jgi:hypothetical protein
VAFLALTGLGLMAALGVSHAMFSRLGWTIAFTCGLGSIQFLWQAFRPPAVKVSFEA